MSHSYPTIPPPPPPPASPMARELSDIDLTLRRPSLSAAEAAELLPRFELAPIDERVPPPPPPMGGMRGTMTMTAPMPKNAVSPSVAPIAMPSYSSDAGDTLHSSRPSRWILVAAAAFVASVVVASGVMLATGGFDLATGTTPTVSPSLASMSTSTSAAESDEEAVPTTTVVDSPPAANTAVPPVATATAVATTTVATTTTAKPTTSNTGTVPAKSPSAGTKVLNGGGATGVVKTLASAAGQAITVDGVAIGVAPKPAIVHCGSHSIRVGAGAPQQVQVPCGGTIVVK